MCAELILIVSGTLCKGEGCDQRYHRQYFLAFRNHVSNRRSRKHVRLKLELPKLKKAVEDNDRITDFETFCNGISKWHPKYRVIRDGENLYLSLHCKGKYFGQKPLFLPSPSPYFFPVFSAKQ